ncbi:3030_t:CDS:2 [Funneliformis geosporum]|uniref:3030_t:CDS:1 n=1 Tax=Funneliformis geosporum TaxID=1117311 RepID=A0A9W4SH83_9GLOM|nr:3030_t:CDS:2 [Funneliformis geosporum]
MFNPKKIPLITPPAIIYNSFTTHKVKTRLHGESSVTRKNFDKMWKKSLSSDKMISIAKETFRLTQRQQQLSPCLVTSLLRINNKQFKIHPSSYKKYHWTTKSVPDPPKPKKPSRPPRKKVEKEEKSNKTQKPINQYVVKHSEISKHKIIKQIPKKDLTIYTSNVKEPEIDLTDIVEASPTSFQLQVGDFVEVRSRDPTSTANKNEILLSNHHLLLTRSEDIVFKITGYAYNKEFNNSKLEFGSPIPETYGKLAADLNKSAQMLLLSKTFAFRQIHSQFADELENKKIMIQDAARHTFQIDNPTEVQLLATHMYFFKENIYFMADPLEIRKNGTYILRSKKTVNAITKVLEWIRLRDSRVIRFQEKVTKIIQHIRSINENVSELPSYIKEVTLPEFTPDDQMFINLVKTFILTPKNNQSGLDAHLSAILKPLKLYESDFDRECAIQFLKEIGVWAPWENLMVYDETAKLSGHGVSKEADKEQEDIIKLSENLLNSQPFNTSKNNPTTLTPSPLIKTKDFLGADDFYSHDICEDIRYDFGNLPVYTIDDPTAHELDDGISIERINNSSETETIWVHIHVADPSTYIHPGHRLAQIARSRVQTVYFPERNYSMLPSSLSEKIFSLGVNAETRGNHVMTFSARIGYDASLLEYKVRPSIVRNVRTLYYDDIDKFLSWDSFSKIKEEIDFIKKQIYFHPHQIPVPVNAHQTLPFSAQQDLKDLQKIADIHFKSRKQKGTFSSNLPQGNVALSPFPLFKTRSDIQYPIIFTGLPSIQVNLDKFNYSPARMMVAEMMVMAGRIASIFCSERQIPIMFRSQPKSDSAELDEILSNIDKEVGLIPNTHIFKVRSLMQPVKTVVEPKPHFSMGITEGYSKVTSPLRRYGDLLAHWQMKASLLNERMPFSKDELNNNIPQITHFEKEIRRLQVRSSKFWILNLINRLKASGNLPEMTGIIIEEFDKGDRTVLIREFGIQGKLTKSTGQLGDIIKLKVLDIMPNKHNITFEPVNT